MATPVVFKSDRTMADRKAEERSALDLAIGSLSGAVKALERGCRQLPTDQDFHFYSNFQEFKRPEADIQARVVSLLSQIGALEEVRSRPTTFPADLDEDYDWLVRLQDDLLEKVDGNLDRFHLERKDQRKQKPESIGLEASSKEEVSGRENPVAAAEESKSGGVKVARRKEKATLRSPIPFHIPSIPRPQDKFDEAVDNSNALFKHPVPRERNQESLERAQSSGGSSASLGLTVATSPLRVSGENGHPLEEDLMKMAYVKPISEVKIRNFKSLAGTPFSFVTTLKELRRMGDKLRMAGEIAVDLENHHYRSYQGFTCLMQVSTREEDFIVDTLELRSHIAPCLGSIFADPAIAKIMHGADRDIVWLQRDFGIYVCNLFDTGQAARVLKLEGFGLGFLLEHFCGVHADKRYQLADWRIRPLPEEMIKYAREDTHYLLFVCDMLKQELLRARADGKSDEDDPYLDVYKRSRDVCLQLYAKEVFSEVSYQHVHGLQDKKLRPEQMAVLAGLYAWRDQISRREDESTGYVLPNHLLLQLASEMPRTVRQLQSSLRKSHVLVSQNASAVIDIIRQCKENAVKNAESALLDRDPNERQGASVKEQMLLSDRGKSKADETGQGAGTASNAVDGIREIPESSDVGQQIAAKLGGLVVVSRKEASSFLQGRQRKVLSSKLDGTFPSSPIQAEDPFHASGQQRRLTATLTAPTAPDIETRADVGQAMVDVFTAEDGDMSHADEGLEQDQAIGITSSIISPLIKPDIREEEIGGAIIPIKDPSHVPDLVSVQGSFRQSGTDPEFPHFSKNPGNGSMTPSSSSFDKPSDGALLVGTKRKPSKLGAFFGGGQRKRQARADQSLMDIEHEVRTGTNDHDIKLSMVLPFRSTSSLLPDVSEGNAQPSVAGKGNINTAAGMHTLDSRSGEDGVRPPHETQEGPRPGTASPTQTCLVLETEADEDDNLANDSIAVHTHADEGKKHRMWWPANGDNRVETPGEDIRASPDVVNGSNQAHKPDLFSSVLRPDLSFDQPDDDGKQQLPLSLSEMHPTSRRGKGKRRRKRSDLSGDVNAEVLATGPRSQGHDFGTKEREGGLSLSVDSGAGAKSVGRNASHLDCESFKYSEARKSFGLEYLYADRRGDAQENGTTARGRGRDKGRGRGRDNGRGRGGGESSSRWGISLSKSAFDPLRRMMGDPKPEGIKRGQRRQVFPQSGNRTATFKN